MWHEAKKSEKKVMNMMIDMQKRAERRRAYYDKLGEDPMQLLRLTGTPCKIHLEPAVAVAAESSSVMVPLRCDSNILIDRWDVRASMDIIPVHKSNPSALPEMDFAEQQCNYERYRVLVQNKFKSVDEEGYLQSIDMEELYPKSRATKKADKKKLSAQKAAIGYKYDDGAAPSTEQEAAAAELAKLVGKPDVDEDGEPMAAVGADGASSDEDDALRNKDPPLILDGNNAEQNSELNRIGLSFGLSNFTSMVTSQIMDAKVDKEAEEKGNAIDALSRTSRRNRGKRIELRREKDQILLSRPSYAQRSSPTYEDYPSKLSGSESSDDSDRSRSASPAIEIISGYSGGTASASPAVTKSRGSSSRAKSLTSSSSSSSSRRHGEASPWSSDRRQQHRSPESSRHHHSRSRSPHSRSRYTDEHASGRSYYSDHAAGRDRRRSRSRSRDREHNRDYQYRSSRADSDVRSQDRPRYRSRSRSPRERVEHQDRRNRRSPDYSHEKQSTKQAPETGALAAAKKLIQSKGADKPKLTPQERLKLKMQLQLARTQKTDRAKVATKVEKEESERQERMDEIMEQSRRMRDKDRRQRDDEWRYNERSSSPNNSERGYGSSSSRYR